MSGSLAPQIPTGGEPLFDANLRSFRHDPLVTDFSVFSGKIGIFGGTFDPVHNGHIAVAESVKAALGLDAVVFVPAGQNPLKANAAKASNQDRLAMLTAALESRPGLFVSPIEFQRLGPSYTVDTLAQVHAQIRPDVELYLIVGGDAISALPKWSRYQDLFKLAKMATVNRETFDEKSLSELATVLSATELSSLLENHVAMASVPVSSTEIRARLGQGDLPLDMIPLEVARYIAAAGLYQVADKRDSLQ